MADDGKKTFSKVGALGGSAGGLGLAAAAFWAERRYSPDELPWGWMMFTTLLLTGLTIVGVVFASRKNEVWDGWAGVLMIFLVAMFGALAGIRFGM